MKSATTTFKLASRLEEQALEVAALRSAVEGQLARIANMQAVRHLPPTAWNRANLAHLLPHSGGPHQVATKRIVYS